VDAGEGYRASTRYGTTPEEARAGESLDRLLSAEEPDLGLDFTWSDEDDPPDEGCLAQERAGRLVAPDEGAHTVDEADLIAFDVGVDGAGASPEEAAVHLCDDPPWT
jgi:hypothetical protein